MVRYTAPMKSLVLFLALLSVFSMTACGNAEKVEALSSALDALQDELEETRDEVEEIRDELDELENERSENGGEDGEGGEAAALPYTIYNLGLFTVNLRGTGGGRVLRMEISVKVDTALEEAGTMDDRKDELRHHIITMVSDYSYTDLDGLDGKTRLADELLIRLNRLMGNDRIDALFFAQFVVQ